MGYQKDNYRRIRTEYETKALDAQKEADARRAELYDAIPNLKALDMRLSTFGLRIMQAALQGGDTAGAIAELREENEKFVRTRGELLRAHGFPADYSDPHYECSVCKDSGYVGIRMCECMRRKLIEAGMESSGLATLMRTHSFDNFSLDYYKSNAEEYARMERNYHAVRS